MESSADYSPGDTSEVVKEASSVEQESSSYIVDEREEAERVRTVKKLMKETGYLQDKLDEREKIYQNLENKSSAKLKELEDRVIALKLEIEALNYEHDEHEEEAMGRHEVHRRRKESSEFQLAFKEMEGDVLKKMDGCEKIFKGKIDESMDQVRNLRTEVDSLRYQNDESRKNFLYEKEKELESSRIQNQESEMEFNKKTKEAMDECEKIFKDKIEESMDRVRNLQMEIDCLRSQNDEGRKNFIYEKEQELESLRIQNKESETELKMKSKESADSLELKNILERRVKDLEIMILSTNDENEKQKTTISQLEKQLQEKEGQISTLESEMKSLEQKLKSLEVDKKELEVKNDVLAATLEQRDATMCNLNHDAKATFRTTMKKMEEIMEEFRKKSEASVRILSQRIRVAEQLHNETKDWYKKTKDKFEQDQRDSELAVQTIKLVMTKVSDTLTVSETLGLRFTECCEAFTNRVSKVSCGINFAKDWVSRKNDVMAQTKEDLDELLVRLDETEEETLGSRQKVLKLETKLRVLKKTLKENAEAMIVLKEEKREAIRQLCVWTDYHRSRSDYLQKAFSELVARTRRPS